jgi:hypothetical protein
MVVELGMYGRWHATSRGGCGGLVSGDDGAKYRVNVRAMWGDSLPVSVEEVRREDGEKVQRDDSDIISATGGGDTASVTDSEWVMGKDRGGGHRLA